MKDLQPFADRLRVAEVARGTAHPVRTARPATRALVIESLLRRPDAAAGHRNRAR